MLRSISTFTLLLFFAANLTGQVQINLTEDLVMTETMVISENTVINGNGFSIICQDCNPVFTVEGETQLDIFDAKFPRVYERWVKVLSPGGKATWNTNRMVGFIEWTGENQ